MVVGLGEACKIAKNEMQMDYEHVSKLSKLLVDGMLSKVSHIIRNGSEDPKYQYPGTNMHVNFLNLIL